MKRKKGLIILISLATIVVLMGATMAAFVASVPVEEEVSTSTLAVDIVQTGDTTSQMQPIDVADKGAMGFQYMGLPGAIVNEKVAVVNTEAKECYIRVVINRAWINDTGEKIFEKDGISLMPEDIEILTNSGNWDIKTDPEDPEVIYCYYKNVVQGKSQTDNVMDSFSVLTKKIEQNSNHYTELRSEITFQAEAIQTTAAKDAMLAEWGVIAEIDENTGNIISYIEQ